MKKIEKHGIMAGRYLLGSHVAARPFSIGPSGNLLICDLGMLHAGQTTRVQMSLTAEGVQERSLEHTALASARETDLGPLDNSDTTTMTVWVRSDLLVRSEVSGPAVAGEMLRLVGTVDQRQQGREGVTSHPADPA